MDPPTEPTPNASSKPAYQQFLIAVAFQILAPWVPLFIEAVVNGGTISAGSLTIVAALFCVAIAVSSAFVAFCAYASLISVVFSAFYGIILIDPGRIPLAADAAIWTMVIVGLAHGVERYWRHAVCGHKYLAFHFSPID